MKTATPSKLFLAAEAFRVGCVGVVDARKALDRAQLAYDAATRANDDARRALCNAAMQAGFDAEGDE